MQKKGLLYDKNGEEHYNIISALHKSLRGSDVHASIYWLARMLEAGDDPLYIARRLIRFASEDVGNADPRALQIALEAKEAVHFTGLPEGKLALAQACIYLATAPKSNSVYTAYSKAVDTIKKTGTLPVPMHIRNAPTKLMKNLGYGKNYRYDHSFPDGISDQGFLPEEIKSSRFYSPVDRGFEKIIKERVAYIERKKSGKK
jgi:putative ATPase